MRELIITADDFGASSQVNEAIERLHQGGFLTQASLMVNGPGVEEALRIAHRNPGLVVGLHLTLCESSPGWNGLRFYFQPSARARLREMIDSQFKQFVQLGLQPSYWDGHMHLHLHPTVLAVTLALESTAGFYGMRLVREAGMQPAPAIFRWLSGRAQVLLSARRFRFADYTFGLVQTGRITNAYATKVLERLEDGCSEFYLHPGVDAEELDAARLAAIAAELGIRLTSLWDARNAKRYALTQAEGGR